MKVTIADIAKKANVSKMTVSRVINGEQHVAKTTKEKIEAIMKELDYQPNLLAQSLSSKRSLTIGLILPKKKNLFLDNYLAQAISGITDIAQENKYRVTLFPVHPSELEENTYVNFIRSKLVDGLILLNTKVNDIALKSLAESGLPFMLINHKNYNENYNFVDTKNKSGAKEAIKHLFETGRRRIAFIAGANDETNSIDRLEGYKEALKELNIRVNKNYIVGGDFNKKIASNDTEKLMKLKNPPDAIFCADDYMAISCIEKLNELGFSVPGDVSVVGFDDIVIGPYFRPPLTTVRQPIIELGRIAASSLLSIIKGELNKPVQKFLDIELIKRSSS